MKKTKTKTTTTNNRTVFTPVGHVDTLYKTMTGIAKGTVPKWKAEVMAQIASEINETTRLSMIKTTGITDNR